jgi:hypothetical protein
MGRYLALEDQAFSPVMLPLQLLVPLVPTIFSPLRPVPGLWPLKLRQRAPFGYSNSAKMWSQMSLVFLPVVSLPVELPRFLLRLFAVNVACMPVRRRL